MKYRIDVGPFGFGPGMVLALTPSQAEARRGRVAERLGGAYDVVELVEFKRGEVVDIVAGDFGKAGLDRMTPIGDDGEFAPLPEPPEARPLHNALETDVRKRARRARPSHRDD